MKFELTDLRQKFSDEDLINDLRTVANNLGKNSLKMRDYSKDNGAKYNSKTAIKRFGNWDNTLKKAGLEGEKSLKGMEYGEKEIKDEIDDDEKIFVDHLILFHSRAVKRFCRSDPIHSLSRLKQQCESCGSLY